MTILLDRTANQSVVSRGQADKDDSWLASFENLFKLRNKREIADFLSEHPPLIGWLEQSYTALRKYLGREPQFILERVLVADETVTEQLVVYIRTTMTVEVALQKLDEFDHHWFLRQIDYVGDVVNFNLEFI
jgi:hypothetical protein